MKPMLLICCSLLLILSGASQPQDAPVFESDALVVTHSTQKIVTGLSEAEECGKGVYLVPDETDIQLRTAEIVTIETQAKQVSVICKFTNGKSANYEKLSGNRLALFESGEYSLIITVVDFDLAIFAQEEVRVTVNHGPNPPPGPDEPDQPDEPDTPIDPDGPFDGLAVKVKVAAMDIGIDKRAKIAGYFDTVADKLESREFLQPNKQAAAWLTEKLKQVDGCDELKTLLTEDSKVRPLGMQQLIEYYREIAKGLR